MYPSATAAGPAETLRPSLTVLVVDDEPQIRHLLANVLKAHGFHVFLAANGREGVEVFRARHETIDLVLLDVQMPPGLDGPATLAVLRQIEPAVRCCFMSGATGDYQAEDLAALGVGFVPKPFGSLSDLLAELRRLAR